MFATRYKILAVNATEGLVKVRPTYPTIARRYAFVLLSWGGLIGVLNLALKDTTPRVTDKSLTEVQHD